MQVKLIRNEKGVEEWFMIEMQGTIEAGGADLDGQMIGNIGWRTDNSEALMLVGHHLIEGKVSQLEKPFLVASRMTGSSQSEGNLTVEAIIHRRLVFKNRPKPIVTKTLVKQRTMNE